MCGIVGVFGGSGFDEAGGLRAAEAIRHRGPDGTGAVRRLIRSKPVFLAHNRLAIIDLQARADQPFCKDGYVLAYNGELYNYIELRRELEAVGHSFVTESDTEVVLEAYRRWGQSCVDRFEGMWSIVLVDERLQGLWISRDRFGEKPLFHYFDGQRLIFASEVKAIAAILGRWPQVDLERLRQYVVNGYRAIRKAPGTWHVGVNEFPAASSAFVVDPAVVDARRYWDLRYSPCRMSKEEAEEGVRERLGRALPLRLRSDVGIGFCLSGGVDSTLLACLARSTFNQEMRTFSIVDRDPRYDERKNIQAVVSAIGCTHTEIPVRYDGFVPRMARLVRQHDAPVATISYYVHSFLSEAISQAGLKVAISGTGADELFAGYYDHYSYWMAERSAHGDMEEILAEWRSGYGSHVRNPALRDPLTFVRSPGSRAHIYLDNEIFADLMTAPVDLRFHEVAYTENLLRNRMMNELFTEIVPVILAEDDLNSMAYSIENRSPFLDRALAEFAYTIPNEHLISGGYSKWMLRAAGAGIVPDQVRLDREKRGFNASIESVLDRNDPETRDFLLAPGPIFDLVDRRRMEAFLDQEMTENSRSKFLFGFVSARLFLDGSSSRGGE